MDRWGDKFINDMDIGVDPSCPKCKAPKEDVIVIDWLKVTVQKMDKRAFTSFLVLLWSDVGSKELVCDSGASFLFARCNFESFLYPS
ncbi:hypothetical protein GOBAR_AA20795 [Gossypium barbadense]|uniref:Uncharacterized protein n=1 Tax=Gossypium barbadense TaxID=3634 RepID=A0A2P5X945_GOSBA|nr:hypothetical protein GOBAR_AA20795 [Gossypium barbadense]